MVRWRSSLGLSQPASARASMNRRSSRSGYTGGLVPVWRATASLRRSWTS
jgi:hypothetical protein